MSAQFWFGLVLGGVLSLITSIAANLLNENIRSRVSNFSLARTSNRRARVLKQYRKLKTLNDGRRDKYLYILNIIHQMQAGFVLTVACVLMTVLFIGLTVIPDNFWPKVSNDVLTAIGPSKGTLALFALVMMGLATVSIVSALIASFTYRRVSVILYDFTAYTERLRKRWQFTDAELNG